MSPFVLFNKLCFSFLEGASHPEELIEAASQYGLEAIALTDRDGVGGIVEAHVKASEIGIKLIAGSEVTVDDGSTIVLLAASRAGYGNLCTLITIGRRRSPKGESRVRWREVWAHAPGLIALWGGRVRAATTRIICRCSACILWVTGMKCPTCSGTACWGACWRIGRNYVT